jgi:hypothetical protein
MKKLVVVVILLFALIMSSTDGFMVRSDPFPIPITSPQNPNVGFSTVEVIDEHTGETISLYVIGDV